VEDNNFKQIFPLEIWRVFSVHIEKVLKKIPLSSPNFEKEYFMMPRENSSFCKPPKNFFIERSPLP